MKDSAIEWTDHTFNPWWGCEKVAQGCRNCYAEGVATRFYGRTIWGPSHKTDRRIASEKVWNDPLRWNREAERTGKRPKVFCASMSDVLEDHPQLIEPRKRLVELIEHTPRLIWQLLTKRPENSEMFGWGDEWPKNVWFGASAATQNECDRNVPLLFTSEAEWTFLSLEPLLEPLDLVRWFDLDPLGIGVSNAFAKRPDWVIVGGESGRDARPCDVAWVRLIVQQCKAASVPVFVKQLGAQPVWSLEEAIEIVTRTPGCGGLKDRKGGDPAEWPKDLRVREFHNAMESTTHA